MIDEPTNPSEPDEDDDDDTTRRVALQIPVRWGTFGLSDPGKIRRINEDAFFSDNEARLWVVADGMGGHAAGDLASGSIAEAFRHLRLPEDLSGSADMAEATLIDLNAHFRELADGKGPGVTIGSTVVFLAARQGWMLVLWVGDSRIYRWRGGRLKQLTQDHSQVEDLISRGLLPREEAESHPAANVVTRAIGAADEVFVDMDYCDVQPGDRFLLCSDGLTKEVPTAKITEALGQDKDARGICEGLIRATLDAKARDNVTVIVVKAEAEGVAAA